MFTSQRKKWEDPHIVAIVELDAQKMWVRIVLAREAMRERLRELKRPGTIKKDLRGLAKRETDGDAETSPAANL